MSYWNPNFECGIYQLDEAHRQLLSILSELEMAFEFGSSVDGSQDIAYRLAVVFDEHIRVEAKLGRIHQISRMKFYSTEHQRQLRWLDDIVTHSIDESTIPLIRSALVDHVTGDLQGICLGLYKHGIR